ncbi:transposase [Alkalibacter mobilis]|uniref:transposase n=1 Tax=Alkalibacter mobilis TaxID=2787712 RepID=UPI00189D265C|nr:transposase [Alkalibacter mobilis]MBF7096763.1 transposase [Alkalibacter mobilis]
MVRQGRQISPTGYYHIVARGSNREKIFNDDVSKLYFQDLLKSVSIEENYSVNSYCILDDHVHLLVKCDHNSLGRAMKRLNVGYASFYNRSNKREGHVFHDRYKSETVDNEVYLLSVMCYIHYNPLRVGLVKDPSKYPWSSFIEYSQNESTVINKDEMDKVLAFFTDGIMGFEKFHEECEYSEHLDTPGDLETMRKLILDDQINQFYSENNIESLEDIKKDKELMRGLVSKLLNETPVSHRKIAEHLEINSNVVHQVSTGKY